MTDMRRTLLWVVFTMSLVLLWDAWNKHSGQPSIFGAGPRPAASASGPPLASAPGVPAPAAAVPGLVPAATGAVAAATAASAASSAAPAVPASQQVVVTTDRVKATFDSQGGSLVRLELLAHKDAQDPTRNVVLLEQSAKGLPGNPEVLLHLGLTNRMLGRNEAALAAFRVLTAAPANSPAKEEARRQLAELEKIAPDKAKQP